MRTETLEIMGKGASRMVLNVVINQLYTLIIDREIVCTKECCLNLLQFSRFRWYGWRYNPINGKSRAASNFSYTSQAQAKSQDLSRKVMNAFDEITPLSELLIKERFVMPDLTYLTYLTYLARQPKLNYP